MQQGDVGSSVAEVEALVSVEAGIRRDLGKIAERDRELAECGLAESALALAREMDNPNSATSKSMCARALLETMDRLRELAPAEKTADGIDDLTARRQQRRSKASSG